ncbi:MAG TPA: hypothetical protein DIT33_13840 [Pseudomonas sp.]|uniref:Phage tail protein n=1 Tax=Pseudomonas helleri TaxID=1608996 RepID=A0A6L5HUN6_9PSED|nr:MULTISPECIES: hypothetical protein [Pseudomonas]MQU07092.1 hypothetical protein [Pseudomonas helleri]HCN64460.1 hypothetical protein [Pseudomonas sp.]
MSIGSFSEVRANSGLLDIQVSAEDMKAFTDFATQVPKAAANAQRRAINKTLRWLSTHIARAVGKQERIAVKAVRQRLRSYPITGGAMRGKLWFGINPLEASRAGRPRQTKAGVSVGSRRYRGAFYKKVYGNQADIWIRTASKHFDRADYPDSEVTSQTGASSGFVGENSDRFPLAKAKISLDSVRPHFEAWSRKADAQLLHVLTQEMNFELQKYLTGTRRV